MIDFSTLTARDVADIALQRTDTLVRAPRGSPISYRFWTRGFLWPLRAEAALRRKSILAHALAATEREWREIESYLPAGGALCDIGCGGAFIDVVAWKHRATRSLSLIDIETTKERYHNYHATGAGYSNLGSARRFLIANGVPDESIAVCNPRRNPLPGGPFDLIISLLSAGHHYPVAEYVPFVLQTLAPGGAFIFDMRRDTAQEKDLSGFRDVKLIHATPKSNRVAALR